MTPAPAAPSNGNGSNAPQTSATPAPSKDVAAGPQTSASGGRDDKGRFTQTKPPEPGAQSVAAVDDDPEFDLGDGTKLRRSALKRELGRARVSTKILSEAQKEKAEAKALRDAIEDAKSKRDIDAIFTQWNLTPEQEQELLSKRLYARHIEPQQLNEDQRKNRELEQRLKKYEDAEKQTEEKRAADEKTAQIKAEKEEIERQVWEYAEAGQIPGFDPSDKTKPGSLLALKRFAERLAVYAASDIHDVPPELVASKVQEDLSRDVLSFNDATSIEQRKDFYGPEKFKAEEERWRQHFISKLKAPPSMAAAKAAPVEPKAPARMTLQEFVKWEQGRK
jgi:hypothetical protein